MGMSLFSGKLFLVFVMMCWIIIGMEVEGSVLVLRIFIFIECIFLGYFLIFKLCFL